jgi:hypothetical protein
MQIIPNITFKSVLQPIQNIEERNEYFNWLNDEGKRLEIAWDCLQLIVNNIVNGSYCQYWSNSLNTIKTKDSKEFQEILNNELPKCYVCGRGGLMLSQIRLGNSICSDSFYRSDGNFDNIKGFDLSTFKLIEKEYEDIEFNHPYDKHTTEKLANIMCNILVNGNFNTQDKTNYLTVIY